RYLQSDPSMGYAGGERYNTYKTEGIPIGPISNVTEEALVAAVYPDQNNDAYYFVTDKYGKFYYNKTLAAHESTISNLKSRGIWYSKY
ncbi:MAG: endolytic transglycosylase MltG, partial [Clostridia bacterium]|nr:endolytic transglycosylase MltG [Clostridia bacterium]